MWRQLNLPPGILSSFSSAIMIADSEQMDQLSNLLAVARFKAQVIYSDYNYLRTYYERKLRKFRLELKEEPLDEIDGIPTGFYLQNIAAHLKFHFDEICSCLKEDKI